MHCYKCHTPMDRKVFQGVLVDVCPTCEGLWLDGGELQMLQEHEEKSIPELRMEAKREVAGEKRQLVTAHGVCPRCQAVELEERSLAGVLVDVCPRCGGIYFDWGELTQVLQATEHKGFEALIIKIRVALKPGT